MHINELRRVNLHFRPIVNGIGRNYDHHSEQFMFAAQVPTFLKAILELHYQPGINPHVQASIDAGKERPDRTAKAAELWYVDCWKFERDAEGCPVAKAVWHSTPGLSFGIEPHRRDGHEAKTGALLLRLWNRERLWSHPDLIAQEKRSRELEEAYEMESC